MSIRDSAEILEVHTFSGEVIVGEPDDEQLEESDTIFYSVKIGEQLYYRWISGPYEDIEDVYATIEDTEDVYRGTGA